MLEAHCRGGQIVKEEKSNQPYKGESEDAFLRRQLLTSWYLQRIKYELSAYLQTRLRKVPTFCHGCAHEGFMTSRCVCASRSNGMQSISSTRRWRTTSSPTTSSSS